MKNNLKMAVKLLLNVTGFKIAKSVPRKHAHLGDDASFADQHFSGLLIMQSNS